MPGFSVKEDSKLGKAIKKRGKKAVTDLLLGGGFYLKGFKPGVPFDGFMTLVNKGKKLFLRDQLETGIVAGKNMAQGDFGSVKGAEKIASQFVKQLKKRKVPKPESRKN